MKRCLPCSLVLLRPFLCRIIREWPHIPPCPRFLQVAFVFVFLKINTNDSLWWDLLLRFLASAMLLQARALPAC